MPATRSNNGPGPSSKTSLLHPHVDDGLAPQSEHFLGAVLTCQCAAAPVQVSVSGQASLSYLCGCSACWRGSDSVLGLVALVPKSCVALIRGGEKLALVQEGRMIARYACRDCQTHMVGRIDDPIHSLFGLDLVHPELSNVSGWMPPEFAANLSCLRDTGKNDRQMDGICEELLRLGLPRYEKFPSISGHEVSLL